MILHSEGVARRLLRTLAPKTLKGVEEDASPDGHVPRSIGVCAELRR